MQFCYKLQSQKDISALQGCELSTRFQGYRETSSVTKQSYSARMACPLLNSSSQTTFTGSVKAGATVRVNTTDYLSTDIICLVCFPCSVSPRLEQLEQQEISVGRGESVEGRILKFSPSLSTVGRNNCQKDHHIMRKVRRPRPGLPGSCSSVILLIS